MDFFQQKRQSKQNIKNAEHPLYKALTRLLSGPIVNYNQRVPQRLKSANLNNQKFKSMGGFSMKRSDNKLIDNFYKKQQAETQRNERYREFDQMEYTTFIASALDIYADEMTISSELSPMLKIKCYNEEIKNILNHLFYKVLSIESNLPGWCRSLCKYGDYILYLDIDEKYGIKNFISIPPQEVERLEAEDPTNPNYVQFQWNEKGLTFENWQIAHFRILGDDRFYPYGTSQLNSVRRIWRQYDMQKNVLMSYRIVRSSERRVFYVDVGGLPHNEQEQAILRLINDMKKDIIIDPESGQAEIRYNPLSIEQDIYIPVQGKESGTKVETLPAGSYTSGVDDVKFLRDELMTGLKIPSAYLMQGEAVPEDKTTLAQKDIRFARTIRRLQQHIISELKKIAIIHLYTLGFQGKDLLSFELSLNNPSQISELQELETWRTKFDVASSATEGYFSKRWIAKNIFGVSDEEFLKNIRESAFDKELEREQEALAGEEDLLGGDTGGEDATLDEPEGGGEEDNILLTAPGKRHSPDAKKGYTTPGSKGKVYVPTKTDTRNMGARHRSYSGHYSAETGKNTERNRLKGYSDLKSLSKGIYEEHYNDYCNYIGKEQNSLLKESIVESDMQEISNLTKQLDKYLQDRKNKSN